MVALATAIGAQQPPFEVPLTYFVGAGGGNVSPIATPKAIVVGPDGDIWIAGVSQGHGLPVIDPEKGMPAEYDCVAPGGDPPTPFEPGNVLRPCTELFAARLVADGSGMRFVKYLGGPGFDLLAAAAVDRDGNLYLTGTRAKTQLAFSGEENYSFKIRPDGETLAEQTSLGARTVGLGVDSRGFLHRALHLADVPDDAGSTLSAEFGSASQLGYEIHLDSLPGGYVSVRDIAVRPDGWTYYCGVMSLPDFEITWPLAVVPQGNDGDVFVAAINPQGELAWTASYGGSDAESSPKIVLTATGEVVVAGRTRSADLPLENSNAAELTGNDDFFLLGADAATGQRLYSGYLGINDATTLRDLAAAPDGSVYLAGLAQLEENGQTRPTDLILKIDREGELVREVRAGAAAIAVAEDGRVITVGATKSGLLDAGGFLYGPQSVYAAFLDLDSPNDQKPWLAAVLNAGDSVPAVLSPGAVVSLYGARLGPAEGMAAPVEEGKFPTQAGGVRVLVGDSPAPLLYVSATQINAVLPFDLGEDPMAQVVVERDGVRGNVFAMMVVEAAPGPFQQAPSNASFGAILNQDGTLNSRANPAPAGSIVALWATGLGRFSPPLADGQIVGTTGPFPALEAEISVEFGEVPAEIRYAGAAPGLAAGIAQINFVVPAGLPPGAVWLQIRAGERQSYPFTYLAVRP